MLLAAKGGGGGGGGSSSSASQLTNIDLAVSGGLAGVVAWLSTFPADVVKTRVQAIENGPRGLSGSLRGRWASSAFLAAARATHAEGGWRAFFAGVGPTVVRAIPVNAAMVGGKQRSQWQNPSKASTDARRKSPLCVCVTIFSSLLCSSSPSRQQKRP